MHVQDFINKDFVYAVIGATTNQEKYGYRVIKDLANAGYHVVGVNPKHRAIEATPVYPTVADVPGAIDVAVFVVPPEVGVTLLPQIEEKGIPRVWLQPGAENDALLTLLSQTGLAVNDPGSCIMVQRRSIGA